MAGLSNKGIASRLGMRLGAAETHRAWMMEGMGAHAAAESGVRVLRRPLKGVSAWS